MLEPAYWQRDDEQAAGRVGARRPASAPVKLLDGIARRLGVPHARSASRLQPRVDADGLDRYYVDGDYHWTVEGNQVAAEAVAAFLAERGLLPR